MLNFRKYLTEQNTVGTHNDGPGGAYLTSDFTGSEGSSTSSMTGHALHLPSTDMTLPNVTKTGLIRVVELNKNPIFIMLSDGTRLYLTYDEYNSIKNKPEVGKTMVVTLQRHPGDKSQEPSQVQSVKVY